MKQYILKNKKPVPCDDQIEWGIYMIDNKKVNNTILPDGTHISTVFLGLDHAYSFENTTPILFETMIFGNPKFENYQERYSTWEEAEQGHQKAIELIFEA